MEKTKLEQFREKYPQYNDMSDDVLLGRLHKKYYSDIPFPDFIVKMGAYKVDPTKGMSGGQKLAAGAGSAVMDLVEGSKQLFGADNQAQIADKRKMDAPLLETGTGQAGAVLGNLGVAAPTALIPGANSILGSTLVGMGFGALQPVAEGDVAREKLKSAVIGGGLGLGSQLAMGYGADAGRKAVTHMEKVKSQNAPRDEAFAAGRSEGLVVPPSMMGKSSLFQSYGGKIKTENAAQAKNQPIIQKMVKEELGIADQAPLTDDTFDMVRDRAYDVYGKMRQAGPIRIDMKFKSEIDKRLAEYSKLKSRFETVQNKELDDLAADLTKGRFDADLGVDMIRNLRFQAKVNFRSQDPNKVKLAQFQIGAARDMEDLIERNLSKPSMKGGKVIRDAQPELVGQFQKARTLLAKVDDVENAMVGWEVDPTKIKNSKKLTGKVKTLAKFGEQFPNATKVNRRGDPPLSPLDVATGGIAAAAGGPEFALLPLARPVARSYALSNFRQNQLQPNYQPGLLNTLGVPALESPWTSAVTRGLLIPPLSR